MPKLVILISGYKRAGKDHTASLLINQLSTRFIKAEQYSFAQPLKQIVADMFDISLTDLDSYKNEPDRIKINLSLYGDSDLGVVSDFRTILQRFGTEAMKPVFGDDVWGELAAKHIMDSKHDVVVIPDYRFDAELSYLRSYTTAEVIHVHVASATVTSSTHASEQLPLSRPYLVLDNTAKDDTIVKAVSQLTNSIIHDYDL